MIPLAVKCLAGIQKFRVPFKNASEHEFEIDFSFLKSSQAVSLPAIKRAKKIGDKAASEEDDGENNDDEISPIEFSLPVTTLKVPASSQAVILNVSAKLKNSYILALEGSGTTM